MITAVQQVLSAAEVHQFRERLDTAQWHDGGHTAGTLARAVKHNLQLNDADPLAIELGRSILRRLAAHPTFVSAALPARIYPPKFNCYQNGGSYGLHVDSAMMQIPDSSLSLRSDVSATLFLSAANEYDGGELEIEGPFGVQQVKLDAGDMVVYPSSSLHRVTPVSRGARFASFFWIQSMVPDPGQRALLFDLDDAIQGLSPLLAADDPRLLKLTATYHNLLRQWGIT